MEAIMAPAPSWEVFPAERKDLFKAFRTPKVGWNLIVEQNIFIEKFLPAGVVRALTVEEMNFYREPFKEVNSRKPIWRWPNEISIAGEPKDVTEATAFYNQKLQESELPKLLFFATPGMLLTAPLVEWSKAHLKNLKTVDVGQGIHFLQEDHPHLIGSELVRWYSML